MMHAETISAPDLAAALNIDKRSVQRRAKNESWEFDHRTTRGGKRHLYLISKLPRDVRDILVHQLVESSPALPAPVETTTAITTHETPATQLTDWQRDTATARKALIDEARRIGNVVGIDRAIRSMIKLAADNALPEHLQRLVPVANQKSGTAGKRTLSRRTLYRWIADFDNGFVALAPTAPRAAPLPAWAPLLLKLWQQPQSFSLAACIDQLPALLPAGTAVPSYDAARRFMLKLGNVEKMRGRLGSREIKSIRPYVKRDTSHMRPADCYTADGHTFDAEVAHPAHGRPFRPEITTVVDVATRRAVGWSAGLNESTWAVLDAQRHAVETGGVCNLWYVDNGGGYRNAMQSNEITGFAARLGITITHSLPYNSQARGIIERSHQTIWVRAARMLPTFMGAGMDRQARQTVHKITRADIKLIGTSKLLMTWPEFIAFCHQQIEAYNARPHRSLPKQRDPLTGKMRHQTPMEAWQQAIDNGWQPTNVSAAEAADLFRPYKECAVNRGTVQLFNNSYFHRALEEFHGERLPVGYDIHDASRVWVRDSAGRLVCIAEFEANKRAYFPQSIIDQAAEKREAGRLRRAQALIEEIHAERTPPALIDQRTGAPLVPLVIEPEPELAPNVYTLPREQNARPMFDSDAEKYRWLQPRHAELTLHDEQWIAEYQRTSEWRDLFGDDDGVLGVAAR